MMYVRGRELNVEMTDSVNKRATRSVFNLYDLIGNRYCSVNTEKNMSVFFITVLRACNAHVHFVFSYRVKCYNVTLIFTVSIQKPIIIPADKLLLRVYKSIRKTSPLPYLIPIKPTTYRYK